MTAHARGTATLRFVGDDLSENSSEIRIRPRREEELIRLAVTGGAAAKGKPPQSRDFDRFAIAARERAQKFSGFGR